MIDVKIIRKPKGGGAAATSAGAVVSTTAAEALHAAKADKANTADKADWAAQSDYAKDGAHAQRADVATVANELDEDGETFQKFLRRDTDDEAEGLITFDKGIALGADKAYTVTESGAATLSEVIVDRVHDKDSDETARTIIGAQGFDLYMGSDSRSHLYLDFLTVRTKAFFSQLEIRKMSYSGGTTIFSNAGSTIAKVAALTGRGSKTVLAYKCYAVADDGTTRTANWWTPGMMALCQTFNVKAGTTDNTANRYYWRMVVDAGQETLADGKLYDYVTLSNVAEFGGSDDRVPVESTICSESGGEVLPLDWAGTQVTVKTIKTFGDVVTDALGDGYGIAATLNYYGYDPSVENDVPQAGDVIVQCGDQLRPKETGNVIVLRTSTEDNATANAPAIMMYHGIGDPDSENGGYSWHTLTAVISPEEVLFNAARFKWFTSETDTTGKSVADLEKGITDAQTAADTAAAAVTTAKTELKADINGITATVSSVSQTVTDNKNTYDAYVEKATKDIKAAADNATKALKDAETAQDTADTAYDYAGSAHVAADQIRTDYGASISYIEQNKGKITATVGYFDSNGTLTSTAGLVTTGDFSNLYATAVASDTSIQKTADMGVYVQKDGDSYITGAKIKADNIELEGLVTANKGFQIDKNGNMTANNGTFKGVIQLSTAFSGNISNSNIVYFPSLESNKTKYMSMGHELEDIGKVVRLYNSSAIDGGVYYVEANSFEITGTKTVSETKYTAICSPQEIIEMTCFERYGSTSETRKAEWVLTGRFGTDEFKQADATGRFPRALAIGKFYGIDTTPYFTGYMWNGVLISSVFSVTRNSRGVFSVTFPSGTLPDGYFVFFSGRNGNYKGSILNETDTGLTIQVSQGNSLVNGDVNFIILDPSWWLKT